MVETKIDTYKVFISHRYIRLREYGRLVDMLDRGGKYDATWRWINFSIPMDAPIMSEYEATMGDLYTSRIRERISKVNVVLFLAADEWLAEFGSLYLELIEGTTTRYRPPIPVISVLPRGIDIDAFDYRPPGVMTVRWHTRSIIRAIRTHALPASDNELLLTEIERDERARIVEALAAHRGDLAGAAEELGISPSTLRRRRLKYVIL